MDSTNTHSIYDDCNHEAILDISQWVRGNEESKVGVAKQFDALFSSLGYAILVGHQMKIVDMQKQLMEEATLFFRDLPLKEKMAFAHGPYGHPAGGYCPIGLESVAKSMDLTQKDSIESFVFTSHPSTFRMPSGDTPDSQSMIPIPFQRAAGAYWDCMCALLKTIHCIATQALGLDEEDFFSKLYFDDHPAATGTGGNGLTLKISWYPHGPAHSGDDSNVPLLYGQHTDYQGFTMLKPGKGDWKDMGDGRGEGGLEVLSNVTGLWTPVAISPKLHEEGALVVNAGDLLRVWTNDKYHSPVHRVRAPWGPHTDMGSSNAPSGRCSIVFFTGPRGDTIVQPIPLLCISEPPNYAPVTAGEHLMQKILKSREA